MSNDSEEVEYPLVYLKLSEIGFTFKSHQAIDDAATFILKKMGIYKKLYPEKAKEELYVDIYAGLCLEGNYYNHKALSFEPFIEPWLVRVLISKETPYTADNVKVRSETMLNANMTDGFARTIRKIIDRVDQSQQEAKDYL